MAEQRTRPGWAAPLVCLALFAAALLARLYRLDAQSLWLDEGSSWELSRAGWAYLAGELLSPSSAYPLYHLMLKGWMALFGDSEAALRLPSALAGALAVPAVYLAASELERLGPLRRREGSQAVNAPSPVAAGQGREGWGVRAWLGNRPLTWPQISWYGLAAALPVLAGPYAIWYSQEAKVYSMLLLASALAIWALARALRTGARADWAVALALALVALFVHRLAALLLAAGVWAVAAILITSSPRRGRGWLAAALAALLSAGLVAAMVGGLGGEQVAGRAAAGAGIPAGPALALGLTFVRFSLDRWPGDVPWWWLAPWALLAAWGLARALSDLRERATRPRALLLLTLLAVPLALFLAQLALTRLYEARYLTVVYPAWALLLAYPMAASQRTAADRRPQTAAFAVSIAAALVAGGLALFQPTFGLFSGDPVKEQYREAVAELAARVQPDDAVVVHPSYLRPLYAYYMGRLTADPAPEPIVFGDFWQGETDYGQREWDIERHAKLAGYTRSFLLIAPDHARTVDRPLSGDEYGLVGNFWAYSREQRTWPCGIWRYNGAHLLCQEAPEPYYTGAPAPEPATRATTTFGDNLRLLGYTLKAATPAGPGVYRAGGSLPISLFWDVGVTPTTDYSFFLHLCQQCDVPPAASEDGPPLEGYLPTSTWLPGKPARDDRAIALPSDLPPGRYTLLLGVYDPAVPSLAGRLRATGGKAQGDDRLVLGTVEIVPADNPAGSIAHP
ncbi:MAG: hypothetical protein HGA45_29410 [Chloroflexales bacterium]|nr:hypothetical protein [Chloroflexales bacterium]